MSPPKHGETASAEAVTVLWLFSTLTEAELVQPLLFWTVIVYCPASRLENVVLVWKLVPSMEYKYPLPTGAVTVMLPSWIAELQLVLSETVKTGGAGSGLMNISCTSEVLRQGSETVQVLTIVSC